LVLVLALAQVAARQASELSGQSELVWQPESLGAASELVLPAGLVGLIQSDTGVMWPRRQSGCDVANLESSL
jgi:hypothetical protein